MKMRINSKPIIILLVGLLLLSVFSCKKDGAKPSWDVSLLLPLVKDSIVLYDVLDEDFFLENPDQSVSLVFNEKLYEISFDSLVRLPDTLITFGISLSFLPDSVNFQPGDTVISQRFVFPIDVESEDENMMYLEKAIIRSGNTVFEAYNQSESDLRVILGIEGVSHPDSGTFYAIETVENNEFFRKAFDISGYHLDLRGPNLDTVNMLTYDVALIIHPDEDGPVTVYPEDSVALNAYFSDVKADYARGYFGKNSFYYGPGFFPLDFLQDLEIQNFSFEEAEIFLTIENTYGIETNFEVKKLAAFNSETQEIVFLESQLLDSMLFVDRATELVEESGEIESFKQSFDFSNSNFPDLLSIKPDQMLYAVNPNFNVNEDSTNLDNFFYYDIPVTFWLDAKVDGGIRFDSLFQSDRLEWQSGNVDLTEVKEGNLNLNFNNAFPFDFIMNLFLENKDSTVIDTLIYQESIDAAYIGDDGFVSTAKKTLIEIPMDEHLKKQFKDGKFAKYEVYVNSATGKEVSIHTSNHLSFQVVGDFVYLFKQD